MSWFSRMLESVTRRPPTEEPSPQEAAPGDSIRLGLDFGTSTTLVAARIGDRSPRLMRLERNSDEMPSYITVQDGVVIVGQAALNAGAHVHSIKPLLRANEPIEALVGMTPDRAAFAMIREAVFRTLEQLKREGRLPPTASSLTVATNVGCTPAFDLTQRARLRDVCRAAKLQVDMVNLVDEPVAAGFEVVQSAGLPEGRTLVIDIGGGTLDVAVMTVGRDGTDFVLHATGGRALAGDDLTRIIETELKRVLAERRGVAPDALELSRQDASAIWMRAEEAKRALSLRQVHRVALPGQSQEVEIRRDWFETKAAPLVTKMIDFVTAIYRQARLTLDRGGPDDPFPGTTIVKANDNLVILQKLKDLTLAEDGAKHLDVVYLVGGAGQTPIIQRRFQEIFGDRLQDLALFGIDPVSAVVLGLARHVTLQESDHRYPSWGVLGRLRNNGQRSDYIDIYEPYAQLFRLTHDGRTSTHKVSFRIPVEYRGGELLLEFRPVVTSPGVGWKPIPLPATAEEATVSLDLFGRVQVSVGGYVLVKDPSPLTPRTVPEWILGYPPTPKDDRCVHGKQAGGCAFIWCTHHPNGGVDPTQN